MTSCVGWMLAGKHIDLAGLGRKGGQGQQSSVAGLH